jgi:hypothetical protein
MSYDPEPVLVDDTKADMITTPHRETHAARNVKNKKPQPHWLARMIHIVIRWVKHFWHHHHHRCVWDEVRWFFYVYFSSSFYSTYVSLSLAYTQLPSWCKWKLYDLILCLALIAVAKRVKRNSAVGSVVGFLSEI